MARCPVCGEHVERPSSSVIESEALLPPEVADASREMYVQLECPSCEAIMGYLGVAAAAASAEVDLEDASSEGEMEDTGDATEDAGNDQPSSNPDDVGDDEDEDSFWDPDDGE